LKKQIINITPIQTAKVFALLYFVMSIPLVAIMALSFSIMPGPRPPIGMLFTMPFIYLVLGFIFTSLGAWVYNLVAGWVGGIEYTSTEKT
jgi:hypothetical protein